MGRPASIDAVMWSATRGETPAGADAAGVYRHQLERVLLWVNPLFVPGFPVALKLGRPAGR
ncbi:hypothetical protein KCP70_11210 [Salmonella enterica subsp. enterica]|nr:hypothetical protein KCP70_11210 [Salmonella enterica subsp. enterica]